MCHIYRIYLLYTVLDKAAGRVHINQGVVVVFKRVRVRVLTAYVKQSKVSLQNFT